MKVFYCGYCARAERPGNLYVQRTNNSWQINAGINSMGFSPGFGVASNIADDSPAYESFEEFIKETASEQQFVITELGATQQEVDKIFVEIWYYIHQSEKTNSTQNVSELSNLRYETFATFQSKCTHLDKSECEYLFTYVNSADDAGRDLIRVYQHKCSKAYYLGRTLTGTRPTHGNMMDEYLKEYAAFRFTNKITVAEMAIDRYEWLRACKYLDNANYKTEAENCARILEEYKYTDFFLRACANARKQYEWLANLH